MPTGESMPGEAAALKETFAGALVRRGEAEAEVTATALLPPATTIRRYRMTDEVGRLLRFRPFCRQARTRRFN
ncbi:hypothetical protein [Mesorhizobium sp. KR1-2]|uniref:hypothetical protein n=1 Tax=Mesorhizobium sp. KR1-2 TaxID=3156609 RepID=UPI0032B49F00